MLYERQRKFDKILQCYLRDPARKQSSFAYIHTVMLESCYTDTEKEAVQREALDHLQVSWRRGGTTLQVARLGRGNMMLRRGCNSHHLIIG